jgi:hypothetical protein
MLGDNAGFTPDYSLDVNTIYNSVAKAMVKEKYLHVVLHDAIFQRNHDQPTAVYSLPSWVPDFGLPLDETWYPRLAYATLYKFQAAAVDFTEDDHVLRIRATLANALPEATQDMVRFGTRVRQGDMLSIIESSLDLSRDPWGFPIYLLRPDAAESLVYRCIDVRDN